MTKFLLLAILSIKFAFSNILLPHQQDEFSEKKINESVYKKDNIFLPGADKKEEYKVKGKSPFMPDEVKKINIDNVKTTKEFDTSLPGRVGTLEYYESSQDRVLERYQGKGVANINISYFKNEYTYKDSTNNYNRTFENGSGSKQFGPLIIGTDYYFTKGSFRPLFNMNIGLSYNSAPGIFSATGDKSDMKFTLWEVPIDLGLGMQIDIFNLFSLYGAGGFSAMGLYQTRSDRGEGDRDKNIRQISPGYYALGKFKINLSKIFKTKSFNFSRDYAMSRFFLNIEYRLQNFENFQQEDVIINGQSIGLGMSFEFF